MLVPADLFLQQLPCKVDPALDSPQWFVQHVRDLVVFITIEIQQERGLEYFRQLLDSSIDLLVWRLICCWSEECLSLL